MHTYWHAFSVIFSRDIVLASRCRAELVNPLVFFIVVIALFPFAFGSDAELLKKDNGRDDLDYCIAGLNAFSGRYIPF